MGHPFSISISLEDVQTNFKKFGAEGDNIKFLKGWVKDTLNPNTFKVSKIALLRVDVDAYSATLEVLEALYDKVQVGGYIVFDDSALVECQAAIREFKRKYNVTFDLIYPSGRIGNDLDENGGYFKKVL
jgi:O-methyltransferase